MNKDALNRAAGDDPPPAAVAEAAAERRPLALLPFVLAAAAEVGAVALLVAQPGRLAAAVGAALLHAATVVPLAAARTFSTSERALASTLAFTLPLFGILLAAVALGTSGRTEITEQPPGDPLAVDPPDPDEVRRMAEALPWCEALLDGSLEERRAVLSVLTRRADADALALLRWALGAPDADLAVEAALALEDISARFETRLGAARRAAREHPSYETALAAAEVVAHAIDAGIADPSLIPSLAHEGRALYEEAARLDPARHAAVALARARLELLVLRPDTALACIDGALETAAGDESLALLALREEAVLASHVLPWEGPSALASYRPAMPPPLTARRLSRRGRTGAGPRGSRIERIEPHGSKARLTLVGKRGVSHD